MSTVGRDIERMEAQRVPSQECWTRAHGILVDCLTVDELACVLAGTFARKMDAEGWPDREIDE